jgi:hypothetical protein
MVAAADADGDGEASWLAGPGWAWLGLAGPGWYCVLPPALCGLGAATRQSLTFCHNTCRTWACCLQVGLAEFVAASLGNSSASREGFLRALFNKFDADGDDHISAGKACIGVMLVVESVRVCGCLRAGRAGGEGVAGFLPAFVAFALVRAAPQSPLQQDLTSNTPPRWLGPPLPHARPACCVAQMR